MTKGGIVFRDATKTEASNASLPISDELWEYLKHVKEQQDAAPKITDKYKDYVCVNRIGEIVKPEHVTQKFPRLMEQNNMKHICFHALRHSCISLIASQNNMKITQTCARHSNFNTTADIYSHITDDRVATAFEGVVNAIGADLLKTS